MPGTSPAPLPAPLPTARALPGNQGLYPKEPNFHVLFSSSQIAQGTSSIPCPASTQVCFTCNHAGGWDQTLPGFGNQNKVIFQAGYGYSSHSNGERSRPSSYAHRQQGGTKASICHGTRPMRVCAGLWGPQSKGKVKYKLYACKSSLPAIQRQILWQRGRVCPINKHAFKSLVQKMLKENCRGKAGP